MGKVYKLISETKFDDTLTFKAGQEFEIVNGVVYMDGYPIPFEWQKRFYIWIIQNPELFKDDTRQWN